MAQYDHFEGHTLAVRGDRLCLVQSRWWDDSGNTAANLHLGELDEDGRLSRLLYFDGDDFASAYQELDARYYAGEGAAYADPGRTQSAFVAAVDHLDAEAARQVCRPEFRWLSPTSALVDPVRTIDEVIFWFRDRAGQVDSLRNWTSAITWMSPEVAVNAGEARGISRDGAGYTWSGLYVSVFRDGLFESIRGFEPDDEEAAFVYAESLVKQRGSRLAVANAATRALEQAFAALTAKDASVVASLFSAAIVYEDRRPLAGALESGADYLNELVPALLSQYHRFESRVLAVRGDRLCLGWSRWSDESGNETTNLHVTELGADGRIARLIFFVEDDFWAAYRELESRYFAGEGAPYAVSGRAAADWVIAISNGDLEGVRRASHPDFRWYATPASFKAAERTVDDMFRWWQERGRQVSTQRHWVPALVWLSPNCAVSRGEIAAVGPDGEQYDWNLIIVTECRAGLVLAAREFDDEDSAFAYAESVVTPKSSRLSLMNGPSRMAYRVLAALRGGDLDTIVEAYADNYVHADHRRLSGEPVTDRDSMRDAWGRIVRLYNRFEIDIIAARGERLHLLRHRWSDDSGNQSIALILNETDDSERIVFQDRFDEDDFAAAYAELERRYYAGEGATYAEEGLPLADNVHAENHGDLDRAFRIFSTPGLRIESRSRSVFPTRTAAELRRSVEELGAMLTSYRVWGPAVCWLSTNWVMARHEREGVGRNGEEFSWSRLYVGETHGGRFTSLCEFDVDDEEAAFAYAEERIRAAASRLPLSNSASRVVDRGFDAMRANDATAALELRSKTLVYDDRRRISGALIGSIDDLGAGLAVLLTQYQQFENRTLAVRGDRLCLAWSRWQDDTGNEAIHLHVIELGEDGLIGYEGRFDEDDFEAAYTELERRYYAGEGAPYAAEGSVLIQIVLAENRGDLDGAFGVYLRPGLQIENRSRSVFPTRTAAELRRSVEELGAMVTSYRVWSPACRWLSHNWVVARHEREAIGSNGETLRWSRLYAGEIRGGMFASLCEFDVDDEESAFAYAEDRMRAQRGRLALRNRASERLFRLMAALKNRDFDAGGAAYSDQVVHES
ncbi:MAG: adenylate cyclase, partial [Mycobacterium sp.]|nr:adenylate cyclase [Mycobacterium sp.]